MWRRVTLLLLALRRCAPRPRLDALRDGSRAFHTAVPHFAGDRAYARDLKLISLAVTTFVVDAELDDPEAVVAIDVDGDAVPEVMSASGQFVSISKKVGDMTDPGAAIAVAAGDDDAGDDLGLGGGNSTVLLSPWSRRVIANSTVADHGFTSLLAADVDGDGDLDVLTAGLESPDLLWHENLDGSGLRWETRTIRSGEPGVFDVDAGDLDGDNDLDVLTASYYTDTVAWYENLGNNGTNWSYHVISNRFPTRGATGVRFGDLNGDGKTDVLAASLGDMIIVWFDRIEGTENDWDLVVVSDGVQGPYDTVPLDFDFDGDTDVVCASTNDNRIAWFENLYGDGQFWELHVITKDASAVHDIFIADVDQDGDYDVLSANFGDDAVVWYEQDSDGEGNWGRGAVVSGGTAGATSVYGRDMDGDGDVDVVASWLNNDGDDSVAWHDMAFVPAPTPGPTVTFRPTPTPTGAPTRVPSLAPTIEDPLRPTARPTHRPSPVPTPEPTRFTLSWEDIFNAYKLYLAGFIFMILVCCLCQCFCKALKPIILLIEPYYMPTVTFAHKMWLRSQTRKFICYPCPEICRGKEPDDPLEPEDGVKLRGDYEIPVKVVYDEPRGKGKMELLVTAPREITFIARYEFYSCYS